MGFKVLVRGAGPDISAIFSSLVEELPLELVSGDEASVDWRDDAQVLQFIKQISPSVVINFPPENVKSTDSPYLTALGSVARACAAKKIPLIQISSYLVFGNQYHEKGFVETDIPEPTTKRGQNLLAIESMVAEMDRHIILRLGWILDARRQSVFAELFPALLGEEPPVVSDHKYGSPVAQNFVARALIAIVQQVLCGARNWGVFHLHSIDSCSEAEITDYFVRVLHRDLGIQAQQPVIATKDDSRQFFKGCGNLKGRRCTNNFGIQLPTWRSGFKTLAKAWFEQNEKALLESGLVIPKVLEES